VFVRVAQYVRATPGLHTVFAHVGLSNPICFAVTTTVAALDVAGTAIEPIGDAPAAAQQLGSMEAAAEAAAAAISAQKALRSDEDLWMVAWVAAHAYIRNAAPNEEDPLLKKRCIRVARKCHAGHADCKDNRQNVVIAAAMVESDDRWGSVEEMFCGGLTQTLSQDGT